MTSYIIENLKVKDKSYLSYKYNKNLMAAVNAISLLKLKHPRICILILLKRIRVSYNNAVRNSKNVYNEVL